MKCDNKVDFVKNVLGEYQYLLLHENLFSLRDLVEINDLTFFDKLSLFEKKMEDHILKDCETCLYFYFRIFFDINRSITLINLMVYFTFFTLIILQIHIIKIFLK